jgi:hypothetical protein
MSLLKFRPKTPLPPTTTPPAMVRIKYGLYPVGDEVLMSMPTFEVIVHVLTKTTDEGRELAAQLRRMYESSFVGVTGGTTSDV